MKHKQSILSFSKVTPDKATLQMKMVGINMPLPASPEANDKLLQSFGLFGGSSDANKFYPDLNVPKDLIPKPEDFIKVPFRLLSATIVGGGSWKATDFSNEQVLKMSMEKLKGKPVYYDHDQDLMNWVGIIEGVKWTDARTENGEFIPAGIDGIIAIDAKTSPKIARGVLIGAIFSNSVTVSFDWKPSHEFESDNDFYNNMGKTGSDGQMVRRVVTQIHDYFESSLVWLGADPFAKQIKEDGSLINIDTSNVVKSYDKEDANVIKYYNDEKKYQLSYCLDKNVLSLSQSKFNSNNSKSENNMDKLIAMFATVFGYDEAKVKQLLGLKADEAITKEAFEAFMNKTPQIVEADKDKVAFANAIAGLSSAKEVFGETVDFSQVKVEGIKIVKEEAFTQLETEAGKVEQLSKDKTALETKVTSLEADAKIGKDFVSLKRNEVKRLYKASVEEADEAVLKLMDEAAPDALEGLLKQYTKGATVKFSGKCKSCGSDEFEFKSTLSSGQSATIEEEVVSFEDLHSKFDNKSMNLFK